MKILKPGKVEMRKFVCPRCGCIFVASTADIRTESGYAWDLKDGRTVTLKISINGTQPQREDT